MSPIIQTLPGFTADLDVGTLVAALSAIAGGPLLGWLLARLLEGKVRATRTLTSWGFDDILVTALHGVVVIWLTAAGLYVASLIVPLERSAETGVRKILLATLIVSTTVALARIAADLIKLYALRTEGIMRSSSIFGAISRVTIYVIGALILLSSFGIQIAPLLAALGVGGLAVALALQDTLSNFFSGVQLLATKKIKPGDFVRLESGEEGYVVDIDWRHTSIRQLPNNMVIVPNAKIANALLVNYYYPETELSALVEVGVAYGSDLEQVERVTVDVAREVLREVDGGVRDFEPFIRYHTFGDFSIDFTVILRVQEFTNQYLVRHEFIKRLDARYRSEGIEIPFPVRTLRVAAPSESPGS